MLQNKDEVIVLFLREFGWTLEYTRKTVMEMPLAALQSLIEEVNYQRAMETYQRATEAALIASMIVNCTPRKDQRQYKPKDFVGNPPQRQGVVATAERSLAKAAADIGLEIPA